MKNKKKKMFICSIKIVLVVLVINFLSKDRRTYTNFYLNLKKLVNKNFIKSKKKRY